MGRIITITNNKGGVLKTSVTTNLAGILSKQGKVLIIDTDNQGNVALTFNLNPDTFKFTLYDVLMGDVGYNQAVYFVKPNIDILPANDDMTFFDLDILTDIKKYPNFFSIMKERLKGVENEYDYILIDTPPNMGLVHANVMVFSEDILIPFQPENYSMRSLIKTLKSIEDFKSKHNDRLNILGVVGTLVDMRTNLHVEIMEELRKYGYQNDINVFETVIPKSIRFASSVAYEGIPATLSSRKHELIDKYQLLKGEMDL